MWSDAFNRIRAESNTLEGRFISGKIAFRGSARRDLDPTTNVDAVLSIFAHKAKKSVELALVNPHASPEKARQVLLAIAFSELLRNSTGERSGGSSGILYVTQNIVDTRAELQTVQIKNQSIGEVFRIQSPNSNPPTNWRNLIVANPGRVLHGFAGAKNIRAMVIDASHPRTLAHLPELLKHSDLSSIPVKIIVAPPHESLITESDNRIVWLWDPPAIKEISRLLTPPGPVGSGWSSRTYWSLPQSPFDDHLTAAAGKLTEAIKLTGGQSPIQVVEAWCVLSSLRSLCVPLEQAERAWRNSRIGMRLCDRIELLAKSAPVAHGEFGSFLDAHWIDIIKDLESAYNLLKQEALPQKLSVLIDVLDEFSNPSLSPLRIVTASEEEGILLATQLSDLDDHLQTCIGSGRLEIMHQREEALRVAGGTLRPTILTACHSSRYRYLDLFPSHPQHLIHHPGEAIREHRRLERSYNQWMAWSDGKWDRINQAYAFGFPSRPKTSPWNFPKTEIHGTTNSVPPSRVSPGAADIDFTWFTTEEAFQEHLFHVRNNFGETKTGWTRIVDVDGESFELSNHCLVDVYRPETDVLLRVLPPQIARGEYIVRLLDDNYDSLFARLCEIAAHRRPLNETLQLERWKFAKSRIYQAHRGNRRSIFRALEGRISVDYPAVKVWFGREQDEDGECMGPREITDFERLASLSKVYATPADTPRPLSLPEKHQPRVCPGSLHEEISRRASGHNSKA